VINFVLRKSLEFGVGNLSVLFFSETNIAVVKQNYEMDIENIDLLLLIYSGVLFARIHRTSLQD